MSIDALLNGVAWVKCNKCGSAVIGSKIPLCETKRHFKNGEGHKPYGQGIYAGERNAALKYSGTR